MTAVKTVKMLAPLRRVAPSVDVIAARQTGEHVIDMATIEHLRGIAALRPLRGRNPAVVVCLDDSAMYEQRREELTLLDAKLVIEREPGPLSARLGRPSVTVCDRYLEVALHAEHVPPDEVISLVRWLEMRCEECPQSGVDMAYRPLHADWD